ncbi:MAG: hypothetical protein HYT94_03360 [Parcubacteria group bacterium]|nr:hypothetical protein [Parcubacteria group bacterium]
MLILTLYWLFVFFILLAPFLIPWLIAQGEGRWWFTGLTATTGAIVSAGGKMKKIHYTDKEGVKKEGWVTDEWTYHKSIVPRGWRLVPQADLGGKCQVERGSDWDWSSPYLSILRYFGIYYIGFPFLFQRVRFEYAWSVFSNDPGKKGQPMQRKEPTNFFLIARAEYAIVLEDVEIGGNAIVDLPFVVFGSFIIPEIAFGENVDVIGQIKTKIGAEATTFFRDKQYEDLKKKQDDVKFSKIVMKLNDELRRVIGFRIDEVKLKEIGGTLSEGLQKAYQAKIIAEKQGDANIVAAKKAAEVVRITAAAEKWRVSEVYGEILKREGGLDIRRQEALEKAGEKGNTIVFDNSGNTSEDAKKILVATDPLRHQKNGGGK